MDHMYDFGPLYIPVTHTYNNTTVQKFVGTLAVVPEVLSHLTRWVTQYYSGLNEDKHWKTVWDNTQHVQVHASVGLCS